MRICRPTIEPLAPRRMCPSGGCEGWYSYGLLDLLSSDDEGSPPAQQRRFSLPTTKLGHKSFIVLWRFEPLFEAIRDLGVYVKKMDRKSSNGVTRSGQLLVSIYLYGFERFYTDFFSLPTTSMNNTLVLGYIPNVIFTPILFKQLLKITMSALNFLLQHLHLSLVTSALKLRQFTIKN